MYLKCCALKVLRCLIHHADGEMPKNKQCKQNQCIISLGQLQHSERSQLWSNPIYNSIFFSKEFKSLVFFSEVDALITEISLKAVAGAHY